MAGEYAFVMKDLRKVVPPKREILRGIYLSFFHGAKIGVLGANGAGKSSLLRIMAGVDDDFLGEAFPADGLRIGYLPQEPALDPAKDVRANVEDGVAETRALLARFEEVSGKLGEPMDDDQMEKLLEEQSRLQDQIDAVNAWDLDRTVELVTDWSARGLLAGTLVDVEDLIAAVHLVVHCGAGASIESLTIAPRRPAAP